MGVSYRPLWIELAKRDLRKIDFQKKYNISSNLLANMGKNGVYLIQRTMLPVIYVLQYLVCDIRYESLVAFK